MGLLEGKVALITGSGGGIGRCHALGFAAEGARVVVNDLGGGRDGTGEGQNMADQVVAEIREAGGEAVANYDSVSSVEGASNMVQTAIDSFGRLDIVVNNAGILRDKTLLKMTESMWDAVIDVHLKGTWAVGQAAGRAMVELGNGGRIINTSSVSGLIGNFGQTNYAAAKAGIYGMTRVWSMELERHGICVNAIAPVAKTRMTEDIPGVPDECTPEHITPMVTFLASDLAEGVTGRVFGVEGLRLFEYRMVRSSGQEREGGWVASDIAEHLGEIEYRQGATEAPADFPGGTGDSVADTLRRVFLSLPSHLKADKAAGWNARVHFAMEGAGDYSLVVADGKAAVTEEVPEEPTCVVTVDGATMAGMLDGSIKGPDAFMSGKIQATRLPDLMKFSECFDLKRAGKEGTLPAEEPAPPTPQESSNPATGYLEALAVAFDADRASGYRGTLHFDLEGAPYSIIMVGESCRVAQGHLGEAQARITVSNKDWVELVEGRLELQDAVTSGKIRSNHMGALVKFGHLFDFTRLQKTETTGGKTQILPREIIGQSIRSAPVFCRPQEMISYARSVDADLPAYTDPDRPDGLAAHPVFGVSLVHDLFQKIFFDGPLTGVDISRMVHGEQTIEIHRPLRAWDLVSPRALIEEIEEKSSGELLHIVQNLYVEGELAVRMRTSLFFRAPEGQKKQSTPAPKDETRGAPLFQRTSTVGERAPWIYAEASGDDNPIHVDPEFARAVGFPSVILQGLCTMGMATTALIEETASGAPTTLERISVRFRKPVFPGNQLTTQGWAKEKEEGRTEFSFEVLNQENQLVITSAHAVIRVPCSVEPELVGTGS